MSDAPVRHDLSIPRVETYHTIHMFLIGHSSRDGAPPSPVFITGNAMSAFKLFEQDN